MKEINICTLGNADSGKSTLLSVLKNKELDDGKGSARSKIIRMKHELDSGKTSSVSQHFIKINDDKIVNLIDLCGHEKYFNTTLHGICGYFIDYGLIVIGGNLAITEITKEHINACLALNIPIVVVITKKDSTPEHLYEKTKESVIELLNKKIKMRTPIFINETNKDVKTLMKNIPIFCVSNKTGENIDLLRNYLYSLNNRRDILRDTEISNLNNDSVIFSIDSFFNVKGVGTVVSGRLLKGNIEKNDKLCIGPYNGIWYNIQIRSFHDNFSTNIDKLESGMSGCICYKILGKTNDIDIKKMRNTKGIYIMSENETKKSVFYEFEAEILIMGTHSTHIKKNYQPIIHCNKIVQAAKIMDFDIQNDCLRPGDRCKIRFRFMFRPEYIKINDRIIFREGLTRGVGIVRNIISDL